MFVDVNLMVLYDKLEFCIGIGHHRDMSAFELTGSLGALLFIFAVQTILLAGLLWCAMKILRKRGTFASLVFASAIAALLGVVPFIGPLLGLVALILLINKLTSAGRFSSIVVIIVAWGLGFAATIGLLMSIDAISDCF